MSSDMTSKDMASIDSMDSDEFAAFSAALLPFLSRIPSDGNRNDRRVKLGLTPKAYLDGSMEEGDEGDVETAKRIANRRGSMKGV